MMTQGLKESRSQEVKESRSQEVEKSRSSHAGSNTVGISALNWEFRLNLNSEIEDEDLNLGIPTKRATVGLQLGRLALTERLETDSYVFSWHLLS